MAYNEPDCSTAFQHTCITFSSFWNNYGNFNSYTCNWFASFIYCEQILFKEINIFFLIFIPVIFKPAERMMKNRIFICQLQLVRRPTAAVAPLAVA